MTKKDNKDKKFVMPPRIKYVRKSWAEITAERLGLREKLIIGGA